MLLMLVSFWAIHAALATATVAGSSDGWTLLMDIGTSGQYTYEHAAWTDDQVYALDPNGNAKYEAYNTGSFTQFAVVWEGIPGDQGTWVVDANLNGGQSPTSMREFMNRGMMVIQENNLNDGNPLVTSRSEWGGGTYWSSQDGTMAYGINLLYGDTMIRWGFLWNNEVGSFSSSDACGGLACRTPYISTPLSGDGFYCCGGNTASCGPDISRSGQNCHYAAKIYGCSGSNCPIVIDVGGNLPTASAPGEYTRCGGLCRDVNLVNTVEDTAKHPQVSNADECREACTADPECTGYETDGGSHCENHVYTGGLRGEELSGWTCAVKGDHCGSTAVSTSITCNNVRMTRGNYPWEVSWTMTSDDSDLQCGVALGDLSSTPEFFQCCLEEGKSYILLMRDSYGDGWNGAWLRFAGSTVMELKWGYSDSVSAIWENGKPKWLAPTREPTKSPTPNPTEQPTTPFPTAHPTTPFPTAYPTTANPTTSPTLIPTAVPTTLMPTPEGLTCGWVVTTFGTYRDEVSWELENLNDGTRCSVGRYAYTGLMECCMVNGSVVKLWLRDSWGDGWNGATVKFGDAQTLTFNSGSAYVVEGLWLNGQPSWIFPTEEPTASPTPRPTAEGTSCGWVVTTWGRYRSEISWKLTNVNDGTTCSLARKSYISPMQCCMVDASVVELTMIDSYGDGWNGAAVKFGNGQSMTFYHGHQEVMEGQWIGGDVSFDIPTTAPTTLAPTTPLPTPNPTQSPSENPTYTEGETCGVITMTWGPNASREWWFLESMDRDYECVFGEMDPRVATKQCCFQNNERIKLNMRETSGHGWNGTIMTFKNGLFFTGPHDYMRTAEGVWGFGSLENAELTPTYEPTAEPTYGPPQGGDDYYWFFGPTPFPSPFPTDEPTPPTDEPTFAPTSMPTEDPDLHCTTVTIEAGLAPSAMVWQILSFTGRSCAPESMPSEMFGEYEHQCCFVHGDLVTISLQSLNGDGWSGGHITIFGVAYTLNPDEETNDFANVHWGLED